jgi:hypothetical protein
MEILWQMAWLESMARHQGREEPLRRFSDDEPLRAASQFRDWIENRKEGGGRNIRVGGNYLAGCTKILEGNYFHRDFAAHVGGNLFCNQGLRKKNFAYNVRFTCVTQKFGNSNLWRLIRSKNVEKGHY